MQTVSDFSYLDNTLNAGAVNPVLQAVPKSIAVPSPVLPFENNQIPQTPIEMVVPDAPAPVPNIAPLPDAGPKINWLIIGGVGLALLLLLDSEKKKEGVGKKKKSSLLPLVLIGGAAIAAWYLLKNKNTGANTAGISDGGRIIDPTGKTSTTTNGDFSTSVEQQAIYNENPLTLAFPSWLYAKLMSGDVFADSNLHFLQAVDPEHAANYAQMPAADTTILYQYYTTYGYADKILAKNDDPLMFENVVRIFNANNLPLI